MEPAPFLTLPGADAAAVPAAFWLRAADGLRLRAAHWRAGAARGTVLLFAGRTEYLEKYARVGADLAAAGYDVLGLDWRGQGMADRLLPDPRPGHITDFAHYQRDVAALRDLAGRLELPRPWHMLAHSMGGCIGLRAIYNGLDVASAAFSAPMWGINLRPLSPSVALGIAGAAQRMGLGAKTTPGNGDSSTYVLRAGFDGNVLTSNGQEWARLVAEAASWPQVTLGGATYDWVRAALAECAALGALPSPDLPMLVSLGGAESVVSPGAIRDRAGRWPKGRLLEIPGGRHEVLFETPDRRASFLDAALALFAQTGGA